MREHKIDNFRREAVVLCPCRECRRDKANEQIRRYIVEAVLARSRAGYYRNDYRTTFVP